MSPTELIELLQTMGSAENVAGMARFGIRPAKPLGISKVELRKLARQVGRSHQTAAQLWASGFHEARILASMVDEVALVTNEQMEAWVLDFDTWDLCDQVCMNLFDKVPFAETKSREWVLRDEEFVKRAGFVLMAVTAVRDKSAPDARFIKVIPVLLDGMTDERNYVKKAVSWSFRQIGKRNEVLTQAVLDVVQPLVESENRTTRWIAKDVTKELLERRNR